MSSHKNSSSSAVSKKSSVKMSSEEVRKLSNLQMSSKGEVRKLSSLQMPRDVRKMSSLQMSSSGEVRKLSSLQMSSSGEVRKLSSLQMSSTGEVRQLSSLHMPSKGEVRKLSSLQMPREGEVRKLSSRDIPHVKITSLTDPRGSSGHGRKISALRSTGSTNVVEKKSERNVPRTLRNIEYYYQDKDGFHKMVSRDITGIDNDFRITGMSYAGILDQNAVAIRLSAVRLPKIPRKLNSGNNARDDGVLEGPDTALVVPDESMLRQGANGPVVMGDIGDLKRMRSEGFWSFESELPPVPTCIVPLSKDRQVLLKIGDSFLRVGEANVPLTSKFKPPLYPNVNWDETERLLDPRAAGAKDADIRDRFNFPDFTFYVDETATLMESWYRNTRAFFNVRIAVRRKGEDLKEYLALGCSGANRYYIQYQTSQSGAWWQLLCVGDNKYVCESVTTPGLCLMRSRFGLSISPPLTSRDRAHIRAGKWPENATLTILQLPSFAVWRPGAIIL